MGGNTMEQGSGAYLGSEASDLADVQNNREWI